MKRLLVVMAVSFFVVFSACDKGGKGGDGGSNKGKISSMIVQGSEIDPDLEGPLDAGKIVIDDIKKPSNLPMNQAMFADQGVVSMASLDYRSKTNPMLVVTLKIFIFDTGESARAWCDRKYVFEGWEDKYDKLADWPRLTLHSKEMNKRIMCTGNYLMTSGTIMEGDAPVKVIDKYMEGI